MGFWSGVYNDNDYYTYHPFSRDVPTREDKIAIQAEAHQRNAQHDVQYRANVEAKTEAMLTGRPWKIVYNEQQARRIEAAAKAAQDAKDAEYLRLRALDRAAIAAEGAQVAPVTAAPVPTTCPRCGAPFSASGRCRYCRT